MDLSGKGFSPIPTVHRWRAGSRWRRRAPPPAADAGQQALLRALRVAPPARGPRWQVSVVLAATIALHLGAALWLTRDLQPRAAGGAAPTARQVLRVELIAPPPAAPVAAAAPQALPLLAVRPPPAARPPETEAPPAAVAEVVPEAAASATRLFDATGRVRLTRQAPPPPPEFRVGSLDSRASPSLPHSPITYHATRFESAWVPADESVLAAAVRQTTTRITVLPLPGGFKLRCVVSPLALGFGCGVSGPDQLEAPLQVVFVRGNLERATPLVRPDAAADGTRDGKPNRGADAAASPPAAAEPDTPAG